MGDRTETEKCGGRMEGRTGTGECGGRMEGRTETGECGGRTEGRTETGKCEGRTEGRTETGVGDGRVETRTETEKTDVRPDAGGEGQPGREFVMERFVDVLQKQDDVKFLMRRLVKWMCFGASLCTFLVPAQGWKLPLILLNALSVGMLSMLFTVDFSVEMRPGAVYNIYECLKYFPVGRREICLFLRKRLLRFLGLYGVLSLLIQLAAGALTDSLGPGSLLFPLAALLILALVGFAIIRVHILWQ